MVAAVVNLRGRFFINRLTGKLDYVEDRTSTGSGDGYVHPLKHPASMIEEEQERSFMSYAEREKLQAIPEFWPADQVAEGEDRVFMYPSERAKLETIEEGANNFQLPASLPASMIAEEQERSFMSYAEREKLQAIPEFWPADQVAEGEDRIFMYPSERAKLETIQEGANNFQLPASLPASMIAEDQERSFMSYAEREKLQAIPEFWPADQVAEGEDRVFMYPSERAKLETIEEGANKCAHTDAAQSLLLAPQVRVSRGVNGVFGVDKVEIKTLVENLDRLEVWLFVYKNRLGKKGVQSTQYRINHKKGWVHPTDRKHGVTHIVPFKEYTHGNVPMQGQFVPLVPQAEPFILYRTTEFPITESNKWVDVAIDPCEFFGAISEGRSEIYQVNRAFSAATPHSFLLKAIGFESSQSAIRNWARSKRSKHIYFRLALVRRNSDSSITIGEHSQPFKLYAIKLNGFFRYHYAM